MTKPTASKWGQAKFSDLMLLLAEVWKKRIGRLNFTWNWAWNSGWTIMVNSPSQPKQEVSGMSFGDRAHSNDRQKWVFLLLWMWGLFCRGLMLGSTLGWCRSTSAMPVWYMVRLAWVRTVLRHVDDMGTLRNILDKTFLPTISIAKQTLFSS